MNHMAYCELESAIKSSEQEKNKNLEIVVNEASYLKQYYLILIKTELKLLELQIEIIHLELQN